MVQQRHAIRRDIPDQIAVPQAASHSRPEFVRLPHPGQQCYYTGMSRSALNALILPTTENMFKPPVRSFVLRRRGAKTGIRLIDFDSLVSFIRANEDHYTETIGGSVITKCDEVIA